MKGEEGKKKPPLRFFAVSSFVSRAGQAGKDSPDIGIFAKILNFSKKKHFIYIYAGEAVLFNSLKHSSLLHSGKKPQSSFTDLLRRTQRILYKVEKKRREIRFEGGGAKHSTVLQRKVGFDPKSGQKLAKKLATKNRLFLILARFPACWFILGLQRRFEAKDENYT